MLCDQVGQKPLLWQQKLHTQEDKREHDLFIYSFDFFFLLFLCCHVVESETVRATEEQRQVMINVKKKNSQSLTYF